MTRAPSGIIISNDLRSKTSPKFCFIVFAYFADFLRSFEVFCAAECARQARGENTTTVLVTPSKRRAGLADAYTELSFFSFSPGETMPKAREAANKALELDDRLGEAHNSLAIIKMYFDWDYAGAEQEFKRAIVLNPGSALIHMWYGWYQPWDTCMRNPETVTRRCAPTPAFRSC